ncbi:MAG: hypothetical protein AAGJ31_07125 [Verrucomicrobiota bacterium]
MRTARNLCLTRRGNILAIGCSALLITWIATFAKADEISPDWVSLGKLPFHDKRGHTPQGLTAIDQGRLLLAISLDDEKTMGYVIRPQSRSFRIEAEFQFPPAAVHTSGLDWYQGELWACDYVSGKVYVIDLANSLRKGHAVVRREYSSGLKGLSALAIAPIGSKTYLVINDFMRSRTTYLTPLGALDATSTVIAQAESSYRNLGYPQGLLYLEQDQDAFLLEPSNRLGTDTIPVLKAGEVLTIRSGRRAEVARIKAPYKMVEDIARIGKKLYITDEASREMYVTDLPSFSQADLQTP